MNEMIQRLLVRLMCLAVRLPGPLRRHVYRALNSIYRKYETPYRYYIHGRSVWFNGRSAYPTTAAAYPLLNAVLVDCVFAAYQALRRPVVMIDVGAAIGDTLVLIEERCPQMVSRHFCVEAAPMFLDLLQRNTSTMTNVVIVPKLLAAEEKEIPSLVHTHSSTAAAVGEERVVAVPLDSIAELKGHVVDVLKVDVDGFDGEVVAGSRNILTRDKPVVVFEWHPVLWRRAGADVQLVFDVLRECGYQDLLWFHNAGEFSHFSGNNRQDLEQFFRMGDYLEADNARGDPHFDIVALHHESAINPVTLAQLVHTRRWLVR